MPTSAVASKYLVHSLYNPLADPEGGRGSGPPPPLKNNKNIGFLSNTGPDPLKITKLPTSI